MFNTVTKHDYLKTVNRVFLYPIVFFSMRGKSVGKYYMLSSKFCFSHKNPRNPLHTRVFVALKNKIRGKNKNLLDFGKVRLLQMIK